jgi:integral membrane sensor domain MASE1
MSQSSPQFSGLNLVVAMLATAALYLAAARLGLTLALPPEYKATAVWPASGIALATAWLVGCRVWPGIWLGAFLANFWDAFDAANPFSLRAHLFVSSGIATGSTAQALLGTFLLRRCSGPDSPFIRGRSVFQFVGVALGMCLVAPTVGVTALVLGGFVSWARYGFDWWTWWLGDTVGVLVITPLVMTWSRSPRFTCPPRRLAEAGILLGLQLSVGLFVFGHWSPRGILTNALAYMTVPLLVWAAFRFAQHGATLSLALVSGIAIWGTVHGQGPFVQKTFNESLLLLQTFVGVLAVTALALAGVLAERRSADHAKSILIQRLEHTLAEVKTLRGLIPMCAWCKKIRSDTGSWEQIETYIRDHTEAEFSHGICPECFQKGLEEPSSVGP